MSVEAVGWLRRSAGIDVAGSGAPFVSFNVGGTLFTVNAKTIAEFTDFCPLFRDALNGSGRRSSDGALLVDRDGSTFRHVINFLRNGKVLVLPDHFDEWDLLMADSKYYGIKALEEAIAANFDYQHRVFRRQLPLNVMLRWSEARGKGEGVSGGTSSPTSCAAAVAVSESPATLSTSSGRGVLVVAPSSSSLGVGEGAAPTQREFSVSTISLSPPVPGFAVDQNTGSLLYCGEAVLSLDDALGLLTSFGYKVGHWHTTSTVEAAPTCGGGSVRNVVFLSL